MRTHLLTLRVALTLTAAAVVVAALALPAGAGGEDGSTGAGLDGHELTFSFTSKDATTACVSYYETTKKDGPAKHFDRVTTELVQLPWSMKLGTGSKLGHWRVTGWATDDCVTIKQPDGTVRCAIKVDGKRKVRAKGTDQVIFCDV
ncbi:MAG: hypothetical protein WEC34_13215 [Acidimicrobiia bacterium]|jgi:hypothetical protein